MSGLNSQRYLPAGSRGADAPTAASTFHRGNFLASSEPARRPRHFSWCSGRGGTARTPIWDLAVDIGHLFLGKSSFPATVGTHFTLIYFYHVHLHF